jgi:putative ABC transport system ATP-binding protein
LEAETLHVLKDVTFEIEKGDFVAIMGESGSGKSTLINIVGLLDNKYTGSYLLDGVEIREKSDDELSMLRNRSVGVIFQQFQLIQNYTIMENTQLPLLYRGMSYEESRVLSSQALEQVGISEKEGKYPRQLSGGQQQRAAIARAIVTKPKFIIADEPTGALDSHTSGEIINLFHRLNQEFKITIIMVTHDPSMTKFCNKKFLMRDGDLKKVM